MKKTDIKEGVTYQTKDGRSARKVLELSSTRRGIWKVRFEQIRGPVQIWDTVMLDTFATWAHSVDGADAPESVAELRAKLDEMRKALEPFAAYYRGLTRVKRGTSPTSGVLWALDTGSEHEVEITVEHLARAAELAA